MYARSSCLCESYASVIESIGIALRSAFPQLRVRMIGARNDGTSKAACRRIEPRSPGGRRYGGGIGVYGRLFRFELRGKSDTMAFIDLGDQFIALQKGRRQPADDGRHFGLVVDDKEAASRALRDAGVKTLDGGFLDFRDP